MFVPQDGGTSVVWRAPAPPHTLGQFALYNRLQARLATATAAKDRKPIEAEIDEVTADLPKADEYRFYVASVTVARQTNFARYWTQGRRHVTDTLGEEPEDAGDEEDEVTAGRNRYLSYLFEWAVIMTCYDRSETRKVDYTDEEIDDQEGWLPEPDPDWWKDPEEYVEKMPITLHNRLHEACLAANPGVWGWAGRSHFLADSLARET